MGMLSWLKPGNWFRSTTSAAAAPPAEPAQASVGAPAREGRAPVQQRGVDGPRDAFTREPSRGPSAAGAAAPVRQAPAQPERPPTEVTLGVKVDDISAPAGQASPVDQRIALLRAIAATVPFEKPSGRMMDAAWPRLPWEDRRNRVYASSAGSIPLGDVLGVSAARARGGDTFFRTWAESSRAELWETQLGKGLAHFALHRYGGALTHDRNDKFGHVAMVLVHGDAIANEQEQRGAALPPAWREVIEYGGFLHDVGYMHGGDRHPSKGALDLLMNGPAYLAQLGASVDRVQLERIAAGMMLHGASFPWSDLDRRLPGDHYVDANLVLAALEDRMEDLKRIIRQDLAPYIGADRGEPRVAWLDDPAELKELVKTGWMLHCADKYCGPYKDMRRAGAGSLEELDSMGMYGRFSRAPIATLEELDRFATPIVHGLASIFGGGGGPRPDADRSPGFGAREGSGFGAPTPRDGSQREG